MKIKKGRSLQAEISGIAYGGKGLARINGLAVFVDQAVPGDLVLIRITRKRKKHAEARVLELLKASSDRIDPPCVYSGFCGGCKWQFLDYAIQLAYKRQHVRESLEHIGQIKDLPVHPTIPSPLTYEYRNKMEFTCTDRRWLTPAEMQKPEIKQNFGIGLHVPGTFFKVFDTKRCLLQPDLGNQLLDEVRQYAISSGLPAYGLRSHQGFWRFLMLRHSVAQDRWMVNIVTAADNPPVLQALADRLTRKYTRVNAVVLNVTARKAGITTGEFERTLAGASTLTDTIGDFSFEISANSFFQTNTAGAAKLYATVQRYAQLTGTETVVDLYSGTGTIPILLSEAARTVIGLEMAPSAVADAQRNCRINGIQNCRFVAGDIRDTLPSLAQRTEVLIIDPPRAGMHKDVVKQVLVLSPERIVYVSCNPTTLARDLNLLSEAYQVLEVQPVDLFPHTYHIESVARLTRIKT
ncbi:MAG: 23S rRNA (uracil(1939)-C(5))-methyltransferase RlmD [Deltaproteobacteria bacterium]|nr:23S rRNA (uracil(1939)-C(5))-methyltransferase RlmD [Deltaproteobacteria bacterium]